MSSFGTGSALTSGASINLTPYKGTDGNNAGTDGLVPGPAALQAGYILGASGDWTLNVKEVNDGNGQIDVNESSNRIATTKFVQTLIGNAQLGGGNANLSALGDTQFANLGADQFLQYDGNKWVNVDFTLDTISNVNLVGLAVGNTIVWDGAEWVPGEGGGGGAANLTDLGDVDIGVVANKHFLVHNGAGQFVNRLISTTDLDDVDKVVLMNADATFEAHNYNFTGATSITVPAPTANTHASTKKYVDDEITGLDLANTYQAKDASLDTITGIANKDLLLGDDADSFEKINVSAGVEGFLRGTGSIDNLIDVDTSTQAPQNGQVLKWNGANFVPQDDVDTNTQLSSNEVKDIVGTMVAGNTETGISVSYDGANRNLDFVVSLAGFSVDALSDVDTSTQAPQNGEVLKWNGNNFVPSADTGKTTEEIQDIVGGMVSGNTETGISVTYDDAGEGTGKLNFAVSLGGFSVRDLSDVSNDALVNGKILKVVNGVLTQADETDTNTQLSDNQVKDIVGTMVAGNTETGISVTYDAQNRNLDFVVASISSSDLTDVTLQAGTTSDVLRVSQVDGQNIPTAFVNTKLASTDLSDTGNLVRDNNNATFGTFTYDFRTNNSLVLVKEPTADTHATTKLYVDNKFAQNGATKLNELNDVTIGAKADAQILVLNYTNDGNDLNDVFNNVSLSGDLTITNAGVATIGNGKVTTVKLANDSVTTVKLANDSVTTAKLANNSVTTAKILDGNVSNAKLAESSLTVGSTAISLGGASTTLSGMTGIDFTNVDATIGASMTTNLGNPTTLTLGGAGSKVIIAGDLQVSGTTTTVNTNNMEVKDRIISLNTGVAGANGDDIGLFFDRGTEHPALFIWDESVDKFKVGTENGATASQAGEYALTLKKMEVETPAVASDTTEVATTEWVRTHTSGLALDSLTDVNLGVKNQGQGNQDGVALANAQILVYDSDAGNEDNKWKNVSLSGDIAISNAGVASISTGAIVNADINAGAAIEVSKLASSSVTVGTTEVTLGNASTTLSGMTEIDFTNVNATIGGSMTTTNNGNTSTTLTLGGAGSTVAIAGLLTLANAPTAGSHATTKTYVDTQVATKQPLNATLSALSVVATNTDKLIYATNVNTFATTTLTAKARELLDDATFADMRTTLGLAIGTNVQAQNVTLQGIADIGGVATGKIIYTKTVDGNVVWDVATFTDYAKGLLVNGSEATVKSYLNLEIGTDVQAQNARLSDISALAPTADNFIVGSGNNFVLKTPANAVTSLGMGVAQHDLLIGSGPNTFTTIATTASVRSFLASGSVGTLSDVSLVAGAVGDVLRVSAVDVNTNIPTAFTSATLSYNDLSNTPTLGTSASKDAGTGVGNVLLLDANAKLPALDGTALTGVVLEANNLSDLNDKGTARNNLGLGNVATLDTTETGGAGDNGKAVITDAEGKLGAIDGSNLTALGSIGLHSNVNLTGLVHGQGLVYSTTDGVNRFEPGTVPTTGTNVDQTPTITAQSISLNPDALVGGDLVVFGRVMEVIDYGSVADAFDADTDFDLDFGAVTDTVIYCDEDYGVLVV